MRRWWLSLLTFIGVLLAIGIFQAYHLNQEDLVCRALAVVALGTALIRVYRTRCLNCGNELGLKGIRWAANAPFYQNFSPRCPHCDVSIDREAP